MGGEGESIEDADLNWGGIFTLVDGETTKFFAGSGRVFSHGQAAVGIFSDT